MWIFFSASLKDKNFLILAIFFKWEKQHTYNCPCNILIMELEGQIWIENTSKVRFCIIGSKNNIVQTIVTTNYHFFFTGTWHQVVWEGSWWLVFLMYLRLAEKTWWRWSPKPLSTTQRASLDRVTYYTIYTLHYLHTFRDI